MPNICMKTTLEPTMTSAAVKRFPVIRDGMARRYLMYRLAREYPDRSHAVLRELVRRGPYDVARDAAEILARLDAGGA